MTPADSPSETVRRHASAFTRTWPQAQAAYQPPAPPTRTARPMTRDELGSKRSSRVQAVNAAEEAGWTWIAHHACSPSGDGVESIVLRATLPGAFPWITRQVVAYWRSPGPGKPYKFEAAFGWMNEGENRYEQVRLGGNEIAAHLRRGGRPLPVVDEDGDED